jgi:D-threo-aldose 1-dehydrogenase
MKKANERRLNKTPVGLPSIIYGTSGLGNLFVALNEQEKFDIVSECVRLAANNVVFDSAGKYGAGLSLETLGKCLKQLNVPRERVIISNKLGWLRVELHGEEPTFEPGVWKDLKYDAVQKISYDGIMECFEQGNEFLGEYHAQMVSVHDPDEYLSAAGNRKEWEDRYDDILDAYNALYDLKMIGKVQSIGVGAKNWQIVKQISRDVELDWIMIANCMTIKTHPPELLEFIRQMEERGVYIINSAVFHSGFLVGSDYYDYRKVEKGNFQDEALFRWRKDFFKTCNDFGVSPAEACVQFALNVPGVRSIALNTTHASRVQSNLAMIDADIPKAFWKELRNRDLMEVDFFS